MDHGKKHRNKEKEGNQNDEGQVEVAIKIDASAPETDIPVKKSVKSSKQKKNEDYRKIKEREQMVEDYKIKIEKDRESKAQQKDEKPKKLDGEQATPNYDDESADVASGAIPKRRKLIDRSRRPKDKDGKIEQEEDSSLLKERRLLVQTKEGDVDHRKYVTKSIPQEPNKEGCKKYGSQSNAKETFDRDWHFPSLSVKSKNQTKPKISARQCDNVSRLRTSKSERLEKKDYLEKFPRPQELTLGSFISPELIATKPRPPPVGVHQGKIQLCKWWKSRRICRNGISCPYAHGNEELKSWKESKNEDKQNDCEEGLDSERGKRNKVLTRSEMAYSLPGVTVSCDKPCVVKINPSDDDDVNYTFDWVFNVTFKIGEVGRLRQIDLLHQYHECYRLADVKGFLEDKEIFHSTPKERWSFTLPSYPEKKEGQMKVVVTVSFDTTTSDQTFPQCLKFDFGKKPHLLQGLNVDIAREDDLKKISEHRKKLKLSPTIWKEGSVDVIRPTENAGTDEELLKRYQLPERIENIVTVQITNGDLTQENYRRVMHQLLFTEELFMKMAVSSFSFQGVPLKVKTSIARGGIIFARDGECFGEMIFQENESLQPDNAASRLVFRNVRSVWLKETGSTSNKVYEAPVESVDRVCIILKLCSQLWSDLNLPGTGEIFVDVQFQLNRQPLCEMHAAIDKMEPGRAHSNLLFPGKNLPQVQVSEKSFETNPPWKCPQLNPMPNNNQEKVIRSILSPGELSHPLVVFGPFGTGKTFTLNYAIRQLVKDERNHVLLCTHTNSAADIHVKLFDVYLTELKRLSTVEARQLKLLRIYHPRRRLDTDSDIAKKYSIIRNDAYVLPTRDHVTKHNVVISTLAASKHLTELRLKSGFFTHILVDEAAQALEPEALIPLALAGPNTKVVFTGDHMQMSPEVYSDYAGHWGLQRSLPERLFDLYFEETQSPCNVIFLTENYRCHPEILQFSSENFYGGGLISSSEQLPHPKFGPILFFGTYGIEEARENSFINVAEVQEVVTRVKEISSDWPVKWGEKDLSQIGVVSAYSIQVRAIRDSLRRESTELRDVTVEKIQNVQGKEFRALFISTVRTSITCQTFQRTEEQSQQLYWEFLSDPKLLNTAITRAKSLLAVVGNAISLCTAGACKGIWWDYIKRCEQQESLFGASFEEIKAKVISPLLTSGLNPEAPVFVPSFEEVENKTSQLLTCVGVEDGTREVLGTKEKSTGEKTVKDCSYDPVMENGSEKEIDGMKNSLNSEEVWPEEGEKKEERILSIHPRDGFHENQDVCPLHRDNQGANESGEGEEAIDQGNSELLEDFCRERFENEEKYLIYFDKIIKEFLQWSEVTKARKCQRLSQGGEYPSLQEALLVSRSESGVKEPSNRSRKGKSDHPQPIFSDYEVKYVNGHPKVYLIDVGFQPTQSDRRKKLTQSDAQNKLPNLEHLRKLIQEKASRYHSATLQLDSKAGNLSFAVVSDLITPDIKISGRVKGAFNMDQVVVEVLDKQPSDGYSRTRGRFVGVMHPIIGHNERQFVCRIDPQNNDVMIPINKSVPKILVPSSARVEKRSITAKRQGKQRTGEDGVEREDLFGEECLFLVQFVKWGEGRNYPLGTIIRRLPQQHTLQNSVEIQFAEHCIRKLFNKKCVEQVRSLFPPTWSIPVDEERRRLEIDGAFTIDPENSKDLDDALSIEKLQDSGLCRVGIHIADVSFFVQPDTPLDKEALFRCSSYYPGHGFEIVPMLPRELSENHCSLLYDKRRLCLSIFLNMSDDGIYMEQPDIQETIVRSTCQLTYSEAQQVINGQDCSFNKVPKDTKDKIRQLSDLAQKMRKRRLREAASDHWSSRDEPEDYEAHELVEEMMIAANKEIAKFLYSRVGMITPLRTQLPPKEHRLRDWLKQFGKFIQFSLFPHAVYSAEKLQEMKKLVGISEFPKFKVQKSVWFELCSAAESLDKVKLRQLIFNEKNHSQLAIARRQFERIKQKAQYVCEGDLDEAEGKLGHFSQRTDRYTHFTSPIRRYIDIVVHRLILNAISEGRHTGAPPMDRIAEMCRRSTFAGANSKHFRKTCNEVHLAAKLREKSHETTAAVSMIEDGKIRLEITNREYDQVAKRQREIKLSSLKPFDAKHGGSEEIVLLWKLRLYIAPKENIVEKLDREREKVSIILSKELPEREVFDFPGESWQQLLKALQEENYRRVSSLIKRMDGDQRKHSPCLTSLRNQNNLHNCGKLGSNIENTHEKQISLKIFDTVKIQLTAHMTHGVFHPEIQLFKITPSVHICVEHRKYPRECFTTTPSYHATGKYSTLEDYIAAWEPVLDLEAATVAVDEDDELTILDLDIRWRMDSSGNQEGFFSLQNEYCTTRQIKFYEGDFVCVRVQAEMYMGKSNLVTGERNKSEMDSDLENEGQLTMTQLKGTPSFESFRSPSSSLWVGHCIVREVKLTQDKEMVSVRINLRQSASEFPKELVNGGSLSTLTVIHRPPIHRRMSAVLRWTLKNAPELVEAVCLGHELSQGDFELPPFSDFSILGKDPKFSLEGLNTYQNKAVKKALVKPFYLIQGPPGTGKTVTGVHIAYWFAHRNRKTFSQSDQNPTESDNVDKLIPLSQVIYCGPSNKSVDVVARIMLQHTGLNIIRVYSDLKEQAEFPLPNRHKPLRSSSVDNETQESDEGLREVSLHHFIRGDKSRFARDLREYERKFEQDRKKGLRTKDEDVDRYRELIEEAEQWAFQRTGVQIILCTCAVAAKSSVIRSCKDNIKQCIVDECGMCMEIESLLPIAFLAPQQVVLIGDHKQLQPVIRDKKAQNLGLNVSMFERLSGKAKMLRIQYRMHEEICKFPSEHFYNNQLETDASVKKQGTHLQSFWPVKDVPMAFCHVVGQEDVTFIKTALSNEQSKANDKEVRKAVHVANCLVNNYRVSSSKIVILSPYREQQERIRKALAKTSQCKDICVTTIAKSQGREWNYVILSLVRSLNEDEHHPERSLYWIREHLGFLADEHLMNVGLTRARKGLCIIGNKELLLYHSMWKKLIESFEKRHCVVNESDWPRN
ncbi:uncharacterized protein LOC111346790 [Stylophora pistillata]|uniref:uncharacterized protein LOC111346790 n=1 Tax=Stylophora pistillata TaxID=50429 RepID=UPI000C052759|nr:uncharacterized protein LOC111346790 [Stylophora pistillata]